MNQRLELSGKMKQVTSERLFCASIVGKKEKRRYYSTLDHAMVGAIRWACTDLPCCGTMIVFHRETGLELGHVKKSAVGRMVAAWHHEEV